MIRIYVKMPAWRNQDLQKTVHEYGDIVAREFSARLEAAYGSRRRRVVLRFTWDDHDTWYVETGSIAWIAFKRTLESQEAQFMEAEYGEREFVRFRRGRA